MIPTAGARFLSGHLKHWSGFRVGTYCRSLHWCGVAGRRMSSFYVFTLVWGGWQTDVIFLRLHTGRSQLLPTRSQSTTTPYQSYHYCSTNIHFEHQNCLDHLLPHRRLFDKDKDNKFLQFSLFSHFMLAWFIELFVKHAIKFKTVIKLPLSRFCLWFELL